MNKILIFAGTTEGRELSEILSENRIEHIVCVATGYASLLIKDNEYAKVHCSRMDASEMVSFMSKESITLVVDATHPYAYEVSENIKEAVSKCSIPCIRLKRNIDSNVSDEKIRYFSSNEECADALSETKGNILLTTGSKELHVYAEKESLRDRLYVRVIPNEESLKICNENGIHAGRIIAMQGPFTLKMNEAMTDMYDISYMVTKQCGKKGGFDEKVQCAIERNIPLYVIGCEDANEGLSFEETLEEIKGITGLNLNHETEFDISLIGVGMGSRKLLTAEAKKGIDEAEILIGAPRLLEMFEHSSSKKYPLYKPKDIISVLLEEKRNYTKKKVKVAMLFSGDASFFSGATSMYKILSEENSEGSIKSNTVIMPGISSVSYFASKLGVEYSEALLLSIHGRSVNNLYQRIRCNSDVFLLLSDSSDIIKLGQMLEKAGLTDVKIVVGENLSYENEKIVTLSIDECKRFKSDGIMTGYLHNPNPELGKVTHGLKDECFIRNSTPMTKEEVREVSICKLDLKEDSLLLDIGSGTGSIAVECALLSPEIYVYAIERNEEALKVLEENRNKFMLDNLKVIEGEAPEILNEEIFSFATHAFIGGSGGKLKDILKKLYDINSGMKVVINAVTLETISQLENLQKEFPLKNFEMVMMQVSHTSKAGNYNLMKADNPVWICSFEFTERVAND